jgi:hypothetical protein
VEVDTARDGFFATFDGPARAVRCAQAIVETVRPLGVSLAFEDAGEYGLKDVPDRRRLTGALPGASGHDAERR